MGHPHIGTEHLLLALAVGAEAGTSEVTVPNGRGSEDIRATITDLRGGGREAGADMPFSRRAIEVVRSAHVEAMRGRKGAVCPPDLMRALMADGRSSARDVLRLLDEEEGARGRDALVAVPERVNA